MLNWGGGLGNPGGLAHEGTTGQKSKMPPPLGPRKGQLSLCARWVGTVTTAGS